MLAHIAQRHVVQGHNHRSTEPLAAPHMDDTHHTEGLAVALAGTAEAGGTGVNDS